jgi:hypothetical protein
MVEIQGLILGFSYQMKLREAFEKTPRLHLAPRLDFLCQKSVRPEISQDKKAKKHHMKFSNKCDPPLLKEIIGDKSKSLEPLLFSVAYCISRKVPRLVKFLASKYK